MVEKEEMKLRLVQCLWLLLISALIGGCATGSHLGIGKDYDMSKHPAKSIVFGKIDVNGRKESGLIKSIGITTYTAFGLREVTSGKIVAYQKFNRGKYFYIGIDPGEYWICDISVGHGIPGSIGLQTHQVPIGGRRFSVGPNQVVYIGRLEVEYIVDSYLRVLQQHVTVSDEYDLAVEEFKKRYPNIKKDIKNNLLVVGPATITVEKLLAKDADVNAKHIHGQTALMIAAVMGQTETVEKLLAKDADVNAQNNSGTTALMIAAVFGHPEIVEILLAKGADVNAKSNNGDTALRCAIRKGHTEIVKMLVAKGADVNAKEKDGMTALMYAVEYGRTKIVRLLKQAGAKE